MKKLLLFTILALLVFLPSIALGQDSTSSSTTVDEIQKSLQERIKKALENPDEATTTKLKAFVGSVATIAENTISINTATETKHATITPGTDLVRAGQKVKPESIQIEEGIIAMGETTDNQTQIAKRIVLFPITPPKTSRSVVYATLSEIDLDTETITLVSIADNLTLTVDYFTTSLFLQDDKKIRASTLDEGTAVIAIVSTNLKSKKQSLIGLKVVAAAATTPTPITKSSCGDNICQNVVCQGIGCPAPETPETCPSDCTD